MKHWRAGQTVLQRTNAVVVVVVSVLDSTRKHQCHDPFLVAAFCNGDLRYGRCGVSGFYAILVVGGGDTIYHIDTYIRVESKWTLKLASNVLRRARR
jgi:hypothetical protein